MKYINRSITHVGNVRSANEDNMGDALTPNGHVFVVCDGMGGHVGGAQASFIAVNSILEYFQKEVYDNVILALDRALNFANEQIYASALSNPELKGMGTTAVVLLIREEECFIAHVGDSRIYLLSDDKLNRLTKDHSFVQTLVDAGVINDEDAESHPNKNQILQALGIAPTVNPTICQAPILPKTGDLFLLCSDGLNGMVQDKDLESIMHEENIEVSAENLIVAALNNGGTDNITASLIRISESAHVVSKFAHFNPKPKAVDLTSTQQFGGGVQTKKKTKNTLPFFLIGGAVVIGAVAAYFIFSGKQEKAENNLKKYSKADIEAEPCNSLNSLVNKHTTFQKDTIDRDGCDGGDFIIIVSDSLVKEVKQKEGGSKKKLGTSDKTHGRSNTNVIEKSDPAKLETKDTTQKGTNPVTSPPKSKSYKVKKGDTVSGIVKKFKTYSPNLTDEDLKQYNIDNNKNLTPKQKSELEKNNIDLNMTLLIPHM